MSDLYPLKFTPIYKEKIWGGQKINTILGKDFGSLKNCGESWEISGIKGESSNVSGGLLRGKDLISIIQEYKGDLVGNSVYSKFGNDFPLLIKFIDANDDLSIQVHPDDKLAKRVHNSNGKTEMWYILQADPGASLISGFDKELDRESFLDFLNSGKLTEVLNRETAKKDDVFFLPAGRIHTIGKGLLLTEIQQSSDVTYRVYDFDRTDDKGNKRELHVEQALEAMDFGFYKEYKTLYPSRKEQVNPIVRCPYFSTDLLYFSQQVDRDYSNYDSFVVLIGISGELEVIHPGGSTRLRAGETMLIPACVNHVKLLPESEFKALETFVPGST